MFGPELGADFAQRQAEFYRLKAKMFGGDTNLFLLEESRFMPPEKPIEEGVLLHYDWPGFGFFGIEVMEVFRRDEPGLFIINGMLRYCIPEKVEDVDASPEFLEYGDSTTIVIPNGMERSGLKVISSDSPVQFVVTVASTTNNVSVMFYPIRK